MFAKSLNVQGRNYTFSHGRSFGLPLAFACLIALSILAAATPAHASQNSIGTATLTKGTCPNSGLANGSCYRAVVSGCPEATGDFAAAVKINQARKCEPAAGHRFLYHRRHRYLVLRLRFRIPGRYSLLRLQLRYVCG